MFGYDYECWKNELEDIKGEMSRFKITILALLHAPDDMSKANSECASVNNTINHCIGIIDYRIARVEKAIQSLKSSPSLTPEEMRQLMTGDGHARKDQA